MRVSFYTLGCKVNQYETQILSQMFLSEGFEVVDFEKECDVCVINSCTVTSSGDRKTRQVIRKVKEKNPECAVCVTGCFPQAFPKENIEGADIVVGNKLRRDVLECVKLFLKTREKVVKITPHTPNEEFEKMQADAFLERTRATIKIEDGCDRYCTYCIIPYARGPIRSKSLADIRDEAEHLSQNGYKEIVLVGINLSSYGKRTENRLIDAIKTVCEVEGIERVRLGSLEPELLSDEDLCEMSKLKKFCPQFHLSLQSGCTKTLERMNRHYTAEEYKRIVDTIRRYFENPSITTDIMVGFAGESEEEFEQSLKFSSEIGFAKAHIFAYSRRPGTKAYNMPNQVANAEKKARSVRLIKATDESRREFLNLQVGTVAEVLFEEMNKKGNHGYTKNYTPVFVKTQRDLRGLILKVKITEAFDDYCLAQLEE